LLNFNQTQTIGGRLVVQEGENMSISETDIMEDLAYAEAEGPADMIDSLEGDMWESEDSGDLAEDYFGEDGAEFGEDAYESEDAFTSNMISAALGAESEDAFFGKLFSGIKSIAQKVAPVVGKIARGAAPILSAIPLPQAQLAGRIAGLLGNLRAEGGTVEDALEAVAEIAVRDQRALPIVAGLAARSVIKNSGANMPLAKRQQIASTMTRAANNLVASGGPKAIRALPKIARSVKRTAAASGTPPSVQPKVVARTASKVAQNPSLLRKLSAPSPKGQAIAASVGGGGYGRTISVPGPATITINVG
jgi:hypothetical protein